MPGHHFPPVQQPDLSSGAKQGRIKEAMRRDAYRPWDLNPTAADHCPAAPRDRLHRKRLRIWRLPHCASQADQNVPLGVSGDLRLFNPLELHAGAFVTMPSFE